MKLTKRLVLVSLTVLSAGLLVGQSPAARVPADQPAPKRANARFYELHSANLKRSKEPMDLLFLGDSITERWARNSDVWEKYYGAWKPANFGIGGDQTQHVLWRIEDGELDGVKPKVVVFMLGTNNTGTHTAAEILAANTAIIRRIQDKIPGVKILLLAVFPRGLHKTRAGVSDGWEQRMEVIRELNAGLAKLEDGRTIRFLDIGPKFLDAEGRIPNDVMPDQIHPNAKGYQIWAEAMHPLLTEMMNQP
jgi:lysophospholipase L1-like esterase